MVTIAKQQTEQRYVFKVHTKRLRDAKWNLTLSLRDARANAELVSLSDSQMLRWIDELNGITEADRIAKRIRREIYLVRQQDNSQESRKLIRQLYDELDSVMFKPDYMCLVVDTVSDYRRAVRGFSINGVRYTRLLGTSGGVKTSTIVFVSERLAPELRRRIDNGRNMTKEIVPAKLEAYRALTCSGSVPVSMPKGIVVVDDCTTHFLANIARLSPNGTNEPTLTIEQNAGVELNASDGFGLMLPALAERWSSELKLGYTACGMNTRFAWEKGMVFVFDFIEFADTVAGTRVIKDVWGDERDLTEVELVLTASQVKLWDSYENMEEYLQCCSHNKYTFAVPKTADNKLDRSHNLNYQFIQSYDLTDEQAHELIDPTICDIRDAMGCDWRKAAVYFGAAGVNTERKLMRVDPAAAALLVNPNMMSDPYIQGKIRKMIKKRTVDAKIGVISVDGNYSILSGDPYALCQSMFGLDVTGLLPSGSLYSRYWESRGVDRVVCFRAPMSSHNNIRLMNVASGDDVDHWYQYITTCTILNAFDTTCHSLNGADFDGDLIFTTNNSVLVNNYRETLPLICMQGKAKKMIPSERDMIESNIKGFGDDIGAITNRVTAMYDVQSRFEVGSTEYATLEYRIQCGQLYQQDAIDKIKGIISNPMPKYWYSKRECVKVFRDNQDELQFQLRICADKKPYFMQYIYPMLHKQYVKAIDASRRSAMYQMGVDYKDILSKSSDELTEQEKIYVSTFDKDIPVSDDMCVMNRICHMVEDAMDNFKPTIMVSDTVQLMKSGIQYSGYTSRKVTDIMMSLKRALTDKCYTTKAWDVTFDGEDEDNPKSTLVSCCLRDLAIACPHVSVLVDILLDNFYNTDGMREFIWLHFGYVIVENLLNKSGHTMHCIEQCESGDFTYRGVSYAVSLIGREVDEDRLSLE